MDTVELRDAYRGFEYQDNEESLQQCTKVIYEAIMAILEPWFGAQRIEKLLALENPLIKSEKLL
jgi:hypothetical protein